MIATAAIVLILLNVAHGIYVLVRDPHASARTMTIFMVRMTISILAMLAVAAAIATGTLEAPFVE
ncbi:DUF2909 family protein [Dokdonella sp. MW10]|uniref:DUF2909 family protein n=1 Tax=Dokdonella sp. MW10 TaxID=2992926 RepID=UPI003F81FBF1